MESQAIEDVRALTAKLEELRAEARGVQAARDSAVRRAYDEGVSWSELAREARISSGALKKLLDRTKID